MFNPLMASHFPRKICRPSIRSESSVCCGSAHLCDFLPCQPLLSSVTSSSYIWSCGFLSIPTLYPPWGICRGQHLCLECSSSQGLWPVLRIFLPGGTTGHTPNSQYIPTLWFVGSLFLHALATLWWFHLFICLLFLCLYCLSTQLL